MIRTIHWVKPNIGKKAMGNQFGYAVANGKLMEAVSKICDVSETSGDVAVHFCTPMVYQPIPDKINVFFSMFESPDIPWMFCDAFEKSDAVITCSNFCVDNFKEFTDKPVFLCPLGYDPNEFHYRRRKWDPRKGEPFRWLIVAAPNARKYSILDEVWSAFLAPLGGRVQLYFKTSGVDLEEGYFNYKRWGKNIKKNGDVVTFENCIIDNRRLPSWAMEKLYHSAQGSLQLHMGEGYGLGALESLVTGTPLVVTDWSGTKDFCTEENSYPIKANPGIGEVELGNDKGMESYFVRYVVPDLKDTIDRMTELMLDYRRATEKAEKGHTDIKDLTWENAAKRLVKIIDSI